MVEITADAIPPVADDDDGWQWAIVEIFGHRRHSGRVREEERFGSKLLRIDVPRFSPEFEIAGWVSHYYGGSAIFSFTPTDREVVVRAARQGFTTPQYLLTAGDAG